MYSLSEIAENLGRDRVTLLGWLKRFDLPHFKKGEYPESYLSFFRTIVYLRLGQITESQIRKLWKLELKLMAVLHGDCLGSPTWMIDGHSQSRHRKRRLFLSHYDVGAELRSSSVQPGLDFSESERELFTKQEMGEDALRLLNDYVKLLAPIRQTLGEQASLLAAAGRWTRRTGGTGGVVKQSSRQ